MSINLIVADPHPVMRAGIEQIMELDPDISILSSVGDGAAALSEVERMHPDVVVLELDMPQKDGLNVIEEIKNRNLTTKPVVFTASAPAKVMQALNLGVTGLVSKSNSKEQLAKCIRSVYEDKKWLDQDLTTHTVSHLLNAHRSNQALAQVLTRREMAVAKMVMEGLPNKKIGTKLFISEGTVKLHLHHIYQKLGLPGRMSLMLHMQKSGLM